MDMYEEKYKCISVRLKVEVGDFYHNLIEPLKENKELSMFIVNALRGYFEDDNVRDALETYMNKQNPLNVMQEQLQKIMASHQRSVAMLNNAQMAVEDAVEEYEQRVGNSAPVQTLSTTDTADFKKAVADEVRNVLKELGLGQVQQPQALPQVNTDAVEEHIGVNAQVSGSTVTEQTPDIIETMVDTLEDTVEETVTEQVTTAHSDNATGGVVNEQKTAVNDTKSEVTETNKDVSYNAGVNVAVEDKVETSETAHNSNTSTLNTVSDMATDTADTDDFVVVEDTKTEDTVAVGTITDDDGFELNIVEDEEPVSPALSKLRKLKASTSHK